MGNIRRIPRDIVDHFHHRDEDLQTQIDDIRNDKNPTMPMYEPGNEPINPTEGQVAVGTDDRLGHYSNGAWHWSEVAEAGYPTKYHCDLWLAASRGVGVNGGVFGLSAWTAFIDTARVPDGLAVKNSTNSPWQAISPFGGGSDTGTYNDDSGLVVGLPRLGPTGSMWSVNLVSSVGPDHGILEFWWATLPEDVSPANFGSPDGAGALESPFDNGGDVNFILGDSSHVSGVFFTAIDFNQATYVKNTYHNGFCEFRIRGNAGDPLTAFSSDTPIWSADGGPGVWALLVKVNGTSGSDYRVGLNAINISRIDYLGFIT
jgi:hypothetical protein